MYPLFEAMTTTHSPLFILSTVFEIKLVEDLTEVSDVTIAFFCSFSNESIVITLVFSILEISISYTSFISEIGKYTIPSLFIACA